MSTIIKLTNKNGQPVKINPSEIKIMEIFKENIVPPFNVPKTKITLNDGSVTIVNENLYEINKRIKN